jgi:hypothetical protein
MGSLCGETHSYLVSLGNHRFDAVLQIRERYKESAYESIHAFGTREEFPGQGRFLLIPHLFRDAAPQGFVLASSVVYGSHSSVSKKRNARIMRAGQRLLTYNESSDEVRA